MTHADRTRGVLAGALAGFAGGLFGVGGGIVLIPLLTGPFRLTQHQAHGTSLAVIGATAIAGLLVYGAASHVAWPVALVVGVASALAAPFGVRLAARLSPRRLKLAFAVFLLLVAARLLWQVPAAGDPLVAAGVPVWAAGVAIGLAVGLLAGFMGVGGGILAVPALVLLLGLPQATAQGTSLAVILVTAPAGAWEHHRQGNVAWGLAPWLALGALGGAPLAAVLANRLPHEWLARGFALFLVATATQMALRARARPAVVPAKV